MRRAAPDAVRLMKYIFCGGILLAALLQGGYFHTVFLLAAVLFAALAAIRGKRAPQPAEIALWCFAGWYLLSSLANGYSSDSLAQACLPGAAAAALYCGGGLTAEKRGRVLQVLIYASAVFAVVGVLALGGVVEISGAVTARRLQFPFQYANAAGSWYAAMALLAQGEGGKDGNAWPLPPLQTALFLTRSIGALGLYALTQIVYILHVRKRPERWKSVLISNGVGVCFAAGFFLLGKSWAVLPLLAALGFVSWRLPRLMELGRRFQFHWLATAGGGAAVPLVLGSGRLFQGAATFAERLCQIWDGLRILAAHPVFGLGAGGWAYEYPLWQSAEYISSVVHSGPVQFGVDAGIPAVLLMVLFCALAWGQGKRPFHVTLAALLLAGHSLLDFNLQFFPIAVLTGFLFMFPEGEEPRHTLPQWAWRVVPAAFAALCVVLFAGEMQYKQMVYSTQQRDWGGALARYEDWTGLFGQSANAKGVAANAAAGLGDWEKALALTEGPPGLETSRILLRGRALYADQGTDAACRYLLDELERRPFQVELYRGTAGLLKQWDAGEEALSRYNGLAERFNQTQTILTALQGEDRVYIEKIKLKGE